MSRVVVLLVALALALPVVSAAAAPNFPDVEAQYMCVTCNIPLPEAESPQANSERAFIRELIAHGRDEEQIKRAMVALYGARVLELPPRSGFNLVAYVVPVLLVVALVVALLAVLPRWRRRSVQAPDATPDLGDADQILLDADLARFDR